MRTITYTYDETKSTNRDYLIAVLTDSIDDGGASYEAMVSYDIKCPYVSYSDCLNHHENNKYDSKEYRWGCLRCKMAWLDREYDTYPSDDGRWERGAGMTELVYTANDEEPKCGRCDNICESDELCIKRCGPEHCWGGYIRTVNEQEGEQE